jgi:hypothetical protein
MRRLYSLKKIIPQGNNSTNVFGWHVSKSSCVARPRPFNWRRSEGLCYLISPFYGKPPPDYGCGLDRQSCSVVWIVTGTAEFSQSEKAAPVGQPFHFG